MNHEIPDIPTLIGTLVDHAQIDATLLDVALAGKIADDGGDWQPARVDVVYSGALSGKQRRRMCATCKLLLPLGIEWTITEREP